jgi:hypothetical protein
LFFPGLRAIAADFDERLRAQMHRPEFLAEAEQKALVEKKPARGAIPTPLVL